MEQGMKEIGQKDKCMGKEPTLGQME